MRKLHFQFECMNLHASSNSALAKQKVLTISHKRLIKFQKAPRGSLSAEFLFYYCIVALERRMKALPAHSVIILLIGQCFSVEPFFSFNGHITNQSFRHSFSFLGTNKTIASFPLDSLLPTNKTNYFRYNGSLTTPTCNEAVTWTVFNEAVEISQAQVRFHF